MTDDSEQERWTDEFAGATEEEHRKAIRDAKEGANGAILWWVQEAGALLDEVVHLRARLRGGEGERCEKCGSDDINTRHEEADRFRRTHRCQDTPEEHLHRTCRNCGWGWCEPALSSDDGEEGPEGYADIGEYAEYLVKCWHREEMTTDQVVHNLAAYVDAELGLDADAAPDTEGREGRDNLCTCGEGGWCWVHDCPEEAGGEDDPLTEIEVDASGLVNLPHEVHRMSEQEVLESAVRAGEDILDAVDRLRRPPEATGKEDLDSVYVRLERALCGFDYGPQEAVPDSRAVGEASPLTWGDLRALYGFLRALRPGREERDDGWL